MSVHQFPKTENDRIEVRDGVVRLKFPTAGGQLLRSDILADADTLARYLNDWQIAWAHETALEGANNNVVFDSNKFRRLMAEDKFLEFTYNRLRDKNGLSDDQVLEVLFNTYVQDDSAMTAAYNAA